MHKSIRTGIIGLLAVFGILTVSANPSLAAAIQAYDAEITGGTVILRDSGGSPVDQFDLGPGGSGTTCSSNNTFEVDGNNTTGDYSAAIQSRTSVPTGSGFSVIVDLSGTTVTPGEYTAGTNDDYTLDTIELAFAATIRFQFGTCNPVGNPICSVDAPSILLDGDIQNNPSGILDLDLDAGAIATLSGGGAATSTGSGCDDINWDDLDWVDIVELTLEDFVKK